MAAVVSNSSLEAANQPCYCYKVSSLTETILDTSQISNLGDRYELGEQLGWGQFGVIRVCRDKFTEEVLACKSIAKDRLVTTDDARSVKLEIEIMSRLSGHPNVVDLKAVYEDEDFIHLVMELCAGGELFHQLEKRGRFSEAKARVIFRHLMQVVLYCHELGIVHRDLKPENILLATKASSSPIKLADFGLATFIKPGQSLHGTVGSPFYIAPEVLVGGYTEAADVWSAGVILYILLSGMPPFWGKTKSRIFDAVRAAYLQFPSNPWDHITESAKDLVKGMLCTDPSQRLHTQQVLDHSWMKEAGSYQEEFTKHHSQNCEQWDSRGSSFSTMINRDQDISFGLGSPSICDVQSHAFANRSSFASFMVEPSTPGYESGAFSFHSSCDGDSPTLEFSSPMSSMPSFTFFSPGPAVEQRSCGLDLQGSITANSDETSLEKILTLPGASTLCGQEAREVKPIQSEAKRSRGTTGSRMLGMHNKRNRTIGLGEREQLDLMVTEAVIRWASCTHLPTAPSLRSSLVC